MDQTSNYKLPRWVEEDRIMMDDFNKAFESIENGLTEIKAAAEGAATAAAAGQQGVTDLTPRVTAVEQAVKFVKLAGPTVTTAASETITFDLSAVNTSQYAALFLTYCAGATTGEWKLSVNGTALGTVCSNNRTTCAGIMWIVPFEEKVAGWANAMADGTGAYPGSGLCEVQWSAISSLTLSGASYVGATATLFGIRK